MRRAHIAITAGLVALFALAGAAWWPRHPLAPAAIHIESGRLLAATLGQPGEPRTLAPGFAESANPDVSFDGRKVLFAGKKSGQDRWGIYEADRTGGEPRAIVRDPGMDCTEPHYIPDGTIVYLGARGEANALYARDPATGKGERLTWNMDPISQTTLLQDGRILLNLKGRWCTVNPDGTGIAAYNGDDNEVAAIRAAAQSIVAKARPAPMGHITVIDRKKPAGKLFCMSAYISDRPELGSLPAGSIKKVRILIADPTPRILAEVPVEKDGSFALETPTDVPLRLQTLGADGKVIGSIPTWIWLRPNESRGCIGCHESRDLTPENRVPDAIRKPLVKLTAALPAPEAGKGKGVYVAPGAATAPAAGVPSPAHGGM